MQLLPATEQQVRPMKRFLVAELDVCVQANSVHRVGILLHGAPRVAVRFGKPSGDEDCCRVVKLRGQQSGHGNLAGQHLEGGS